MQHTRNTSDTASNRNCSASNTMKTTTTT